MSRAIMSLWRAARAASSADRLVSCPRARHCRPCAAYAIECAGMGGDMEPFDSTPDDGLRRGRYRVLHAIASANAGAGLVSRSPSRATDGWPVFPNFTPELERAAKALSARVDCLLVLLLSADEDDLYCMFFRSGRQLPWFKVGVGRIRRGKERAKLATKLEALAEVCDAESRAPSVAILADATAVTFSSELLRALCEIVGIHNAFTSFDYLQRGEREGLDPPSDPELVSA